MAKAFGYLETLDDGEIRMRQKHFAKALKTSDESKQITVEYYGGCEELVNLSDDLNIVSDVTVAADELEMDDGKMHEDEIYAGERR